MKESEGSLLEAIGSNSIELQQSGIQAVRELEQLDAEYPFRRLIGPELACFSALVDAIPSPREAKDLYGIAGLPCCDPVPPERSKCYIGLGPEGPSTAVPDALDAGAGITSSPRNM